MKKITVILSALAFCGSALAGKLGPASMTNSYPAAQDRFYLGLHADLTQRLQQRRLDNTPYENTPGQMGFKQGGFQVGMLFGAVRAELSLDYGTYGTDIVLQSYLSTFLKGAYDFKLSHSLSVYPVAGIGVYHGFKQGNTAPGKSYTCFAWLLGAGATLNINDKTSISGEYNWVKTNQTSYSFLFEGVNVTAKNFGANVFSIRLNRTF